MHSEEVLQLLLFQCFLLYVAVQTINLSLVLKQGSGVAPIWYVLDILLPTQPLR